MFRSESKFNSGRNVIDNVADGERSVVSNCEAMMFRGWMFRQGPELFRLNPVWPAIRENKHETKD